MQELEIKATRIFKKENKTTGLGFVKEASASKNMQFTDIKAVNTDKAVNPNLKYAHIRKINKTIKYKETSNILAI